MNVRILTELGMREFQEYIQRLKIEPLAPYPDLSGRPHSTEFSRSLEIDDRLTFRSQMEMGEYLMKALTEASIQRRDVLGQSTLWTWLAYVWLDQLRPIKKGVKGILETARYVCSTDWRDYYRHLVAAPYDIYSLHGEENSRLLLWGPVNQTNDFAEQICSRQDYFSNANIVEAAHCLYWDNDLKKPKRGAARGNLGDLRRFKDIMDQFDLTYDIHSMTAKEILGLLPEEFDRWKANSE